MKLDLKIEIDGTIVNLACVNIMFQRDPFPGGHDFQLILPKKEIEKEILDCAVFESENQPSEKQVRDWLYWLAYILSRFQDSKECKDKNWFLNNISSLLETESKLIIYGECSLWIDTDEQKKMPNTFK